MSLLGGALALGVAPGCSDALIEGLTDRSVTELVDAIDASLDAECNCQLQDTGDTGADDLCVNASIRQLFKAALARCLQQILNDHAEAEETYACATAAYEARTRCIDPACTQLDACDAMLDSALDECPPLPEYRNCILGI
jgi:hypothetical protein